MTPRGRDAIRRSKDKAKRHRDNWKRRATAATDILARLVDIERRIADAICPNDPPCEKCRTMAEARAFLKPSNKRETKGKQ